MTAWQSFDVFLDATVYCSQAPASSAMGNRNTHSPTPDNSKRLVPTHLFWKNLLGLDCPISDELLRVTWPKLESCDAGIRCVQDAPWFALL